MKLKKIEIIENLDNLVNNEEVIYEDEDECYTISIGNIIERITEIIPKEDIELIGLFGSANEPPKYETREERSFFGLISDDVKVKIPPDDIDLLILTKKVIKEGIAKTFSYGKEARYDGFYGYDFVDIEVKDILHLQITTKKKFESFVKKGDEQAVKINNSMRIIYKLSL